MCECQGSANELLVNVFLPLSSTSGDCHVGLVVRATADGSEQTVISLVSSGGGVALVVNRTLSSLSENQTKTTQQHQLPPAMSGRDDNLLRIFVDKSVIEIFVGEHTILSTRVYPTAGDAADRVGTFSSGGGSDKCGFHGPLESWAMEDVYA